MSELWVEIVYFDGVGIQTTYGTIEGTIEEAIEAGEKMLAEA